MCALCWRVVEGVAVVVACGILCGKIFSPSSRESLGLVCESESESVRCDSQSAWAGCDSQSD